MLEAQLDQLLFLKKSISEIVLFGVFYYRTVSNSKKEGKNFQFPQLNHNPIPIQNEIYKIASIKSNNKTDIHKSPSVSVVKQIGTIFQLNIQKSGKKNH